MMRQLHEASAARRRELERHMAEFEARGGVVHEVGSEANAGARRLTENMPVLGGQVHPSNRKQTTRKLDTSLRVW